MNLQDYLRAVRERWLLVTIAVLVALIAAGATWFLRPPQYTANVTFYVSAQTAEDTQNALSGAQLSQERVSSYVELIGRTRVSQEVIDDLHLNMGADQLASEIKAARAADSVLIDVNVTDRSPQRAADVANSLGRVFSRVVDELELPRTPGAVSPVTVRVVQPAATPTAPSSTSLPVTLALGLLAGLAIGVTGALMRNALDTSVKSPDQLRDVAGAANLGVIAFDSDVPHTPLTVQEDPQSPFAEALRQIRTNLQFVDLDHPPKVIVLTSSMPGEGKTTTVANLAIALVSSGCRVLVIEADLRRPRLADLFGLDRSVGLTSVLSGRAHPGQAVQRGTGGVDVLASGPLPPNPSEVLASAQMKALIRDVRAQYDMVLIDTPPLLPVTDAAAVSPATDGVLLVCRFKTTRRDQVRLAVDALKSVSARLFGTLFTMVPMTGPHAHPQYMVTYRPDLPVSTAVPVSAVLPPSGRYRAPTAGGGDGQPNGYRNGFRLASPGPEVDPRRPARR
jgi:polysaccharide biosynthesis transport protein